MDTSANTPQSVVASSPEVMVRQLAALGQLTRWKMLRELSLGEPREIVELATVGGCSYDMARKHLTVLLEAGLVERGRGWLYAIPKRLLPAPGERVVDIGHCRLRFEPPGNNL